MTRHTSREWRRRPVIKKSNCWVANRRKVSQKNISRTSCDLGCSSWMITDSRNMMRLQAGWFVCPFTEGWEPNEWSRKATKLKGLLCGICGGEVGLRKKICWQYNGLKGLFVYVVLEQVLRRCFHFTIGLRHFWLQKGYITGFFGPSLTKRILSSLSIPSSIHGFRGGPPICYQFYQNTLRRHSGYGTK